ncbi:MAG: hypothetical protein IJZ32_05975 [Clostridia bacterium]|nr:hypothetical protein [Clostridia bacterium]
MKKLHLICNAHLDPIWQWTWDEGISAAIATFKSAADLAEEFDYVFCHGESLLYETIEKNAPELFEHIKSLVKQGKWHIAGGTYLQSDCLMPCGETLVRNIAVGKKYFREKFGVEPTVATNYDSFGHSIGLVQIMAKCGYKGYLICRPRKDVQIEYPSRFFQWGSPDGSCVIVSNSSTYNSALGEVTKKILQETSGEAVGMLGSDSKDGKSGGMEDVDYILWGVGNHGGGPSRKDLQDIAQLKIENTELFHSTPEALFADDLRVGGEKKTSLVTCMPGCYSSMAKVKQAYRRTENLFYATEKMLSAARLARLKPDLRDLEEAQKKLLLASFHDILPGTCIEDGEKEGLGLLSSCEKTLKDYRTQAFLYLAMNEPCAKEGEFPVFAFNYFPYEVTMPIETEFSLADQNWSDEICFVPHIFDENWQELPCQQIKEDSTLNLDWRKRIVFEGTLKPLGLTRFTVKVQAEAIKEKSAKKVLLRDYVKNPVTFVAYDDTADPWGMSEQELKSLGKNPVDFRLMNEEEAGAFFGGNEPVFSIRITESGNVYTEIETLYTFGNTNAVLQYKLYKNQPYTDIKISVEFADKNKLVRLKIPVPKNYLGGTTVGDGPFVWEEKPKSEISFQKWVGIKKADKIFAVINDGIYAGKVEDGYIYLTLLRGTGYCVHPIPNRDLYPKDKYLPRIDCGRYVYNLRLFEGDICEVNKLAEEFNQLPYAINVFPIGGKEKTYSRWMVNGNVVVSTIKPTGNDGYLLRIYNPSEKSEIFSVQYGEKSLKSIVQARAVVLVLYNGEFKIQTETLLPMEETVAQ